MSKARPVVQQSPLNWYAINNAIADAARMLDRHVEFPANMPVQLSRYGRETFEFWGWTPPAVGHVAATLDRIPAGCVPVCWHDGFDGFPVVSRLFLEPAR